MKACVLYRVLKVTLLLLLTLNAVHYAISDEPGTALDSVAWLGLLVLFELEAGWRACLQRRHALSMVLVWRYLAFALIAAAAWQYWLARDWLDLGNAVLWLGVVVMLEAQLRWPALNARRRGVALGVLAALYGGLLVFVALWAVEGDWFGVYDAVLWLLAFAVLERDVLRRRPGLVEVSQ